MLRELNGTIDEIVGNKIIRRINPTDPKDKNTWTLYNPPKEEILEDSYKLHGYPDGYIYIDNNVKATMILEYAETIATGVYLNSTNISKLTNLLKGKVGDIDNIKQNQLELMMQKDLQNKSTDMDCGYWWDSLKNMDKIKVLTRISLSGNTLINNNSGEVEWKEHDVGFKTNKVTYYNNRKQSAVTCARGKIDKGEVEISIWAAEITIN